MFVIEFPVQLRRRSESAAFKAIEWDQVSKVLQISIFRVIEISENHYVRLFPVILTNLPLLPDNL